MQTTVRVFKSGNSQAIRLPKPFRLKSKTVSVQRVPQGLLITDTEDLKRRAAAFAALEGSCPDFPAIEPNTAPNIARELE
ncbi:MAG: AbrB/MazE/SpoVT family DNA-binding domain-containing protein [Opitutaceae bacterium]|nr:AbrB/MazE/SpoVT family DNA-binding domain-containing protein [Opitutaceae bacterium]